MNCPICKQPLRLEIWDRMNTDRCMNSMCEDFLKTYNERVVIRAKI